MAQNNASYIKKSPVAGNGLFAKKAIDTGGLIFTVPRPLVAALDTSRLLDVCANCFACDDMIGSSGGLELKACTGCNIVKFCGKACQTESWKRAHKFECAVFRELERAGRLPNAVRAGMEMLARRKNGRLGDEQWEALMRLETHLEELRARDDWETHEVLAMGVLKYSKTEGTFDVETAQGVYARILTNSLTLVTSIMDPLGLSLDPYPCTANHSCSPNAFVLNDGPALVLRAMRPIAQDEELFISYVDGSNPFHKRQAELLDRYYFTCACSKCAQGPSGPADAFETLSSAQKTKLPGLTRKLPMDTPAPAPDAEAEEHLRAIETSAFAALEQAHRLTNTADPHEPLGLVTSTLQLLSTAAGFAPARQPGPALRDELIVYALSSGQLVLAWQHCAARHLLSDKTLLPASHPLRAVHAFVFATLTALAIMCASDESAGGPRGEWPGATKQIREVVKRYGIELGTVLYALLGEVVAALPKGHGVESRFARAVGAAMARMGVSADALAPGRMSAYTAQIEGMWGVVGKMVGEMEA